MYVLGNAGRWRKLQLLNHFPSSKFPSAYCLLLGYHLFALQIFILLYFISILLVARDTEIDEALSLQYWLLGDMKTSVNVEMRMQLTLPQLYGGEKRQVCHLCCACSECLLHKGARPGGREQGGGRNPAQWPGFIYTSCVCLSSAVGLHPLDCIHPEGATPNWPKGTKKPVWWSWEKRGWMNWV